MFSTLSFIFGFLTVLVWYIWQDFTLYQDDTGGSRLYRLVGSIVYSPHVKRQEKPCTCGAISQLLRSFVEMNRTNVKQFLISYMKKELCRGINHYFNGYVHLRLVHFSMGAYVPTVLSVRRVPDDELTIRTEIEYIGSTSSKVRLSLPLIEKHFGAETKFTCEVTVEKFTANLLLTFSTNPYPHIRMSLRSMPRWFIRKKFYTPSNQEIRSKILSWFVDFALTTTIRLKLIHPIYIMNDKLFPADWSLLQQQEAVFQENVILELTFDTLLRTTRRKQVILLATIEPTPWIHMDLVNLTPIAYFTLEIRKKNSFYPGLILTEYNRIDVAEEISVAQVTVRSILPDSAAEDALFLEGDIILAVDDVKVVSAQRAVELLDAAKEKAFVRVQRVVQFKWSRSNHRMVPAVDWLSLTDLHDFFPYPQSRCTKNHNFDAVLGTPDEIVANAVANGYQFLRTNEFEPSKGIDKTMRIPLSKQNMYISFGIWAGREMMGYGSMLLNSCVGHCQETLGPMVLHLPLGHPGDMKPNTLPRHLRPYRDVPGFNLRLSHGEIVMRLQTVFEG